MVLANQRGRGVVAPVSPYPSQLSQPPVLCQHFSFWIGRMQRRGVDAALRVIRRASAPIHLPFARTSAACSTAIAAASVATTSSTNFFAAPAIGQVRTMTKVYTRTGDKGTSQLFSGERRPKDDDVFQALGDTDELNANIGIACEFAREKQPDLPPRLEQIQSRLFDIGACIATPVNTASESKKKRAGMFDQSNVDTLEKWIDEMDAMLPPLKSFVLPSGGGLTSTHLHVARSVCRRAERRVVPLIASGAVDPVVQRYLNRLSDFLFVAARYAAKLENKQETPWINMNVKPPKKEDAGSSDEDN